MTKSGQMEDERVATLSEYGVLDTEPEAIFDNLVDLAALLCGGTGACFGLADKDRVWYKSNFGLDFREVTRERSICAYVVTEKVPLIVPDITQDERFAHLPSLVSGQQVRFYAGVPLFAPNGHCVGLLAVFSPQAVVMSAPQLKGLVSLGAQLMAVLELKRSQQLIEHERKRYQAMLQTSGDGVHIFDRHGQVVDINDKFCDMLGYSRETLLGMNVADWDAMFSPDMLKDKVEVSFTTASVFETRHKCKNGNILDVEISTKPIWIDGKLYLWNASRDITARKHLDRMKHEFIAVVSHELRTPLTSIHGALSLLNGGILGETSGAAKNLLEVALRNSNRLITLINDILDFEKIESGSILFSIQPLPLMPMIERSLQDNVSYAAKYGVSLVISSAMPDAVVAVDEARFMQVMANLLSNAAKYSPAGGVVDVSVMPTNGAFKITITDHGSGIPPKFHGAIFGQFAQADSTDSRLKEGTGLGLAITKSLLEKMGGSIGFDSEPGVSTRFYFEVPMNVKKADA